jgi:hypothetical protein
VLIARYFMTTDTRVNLTMKADFDRSTPARMYYAIAGLTILLWMTEPLHGVSSNIVGFVPVVALLALRVMGGRDIQNLSWPVLWLVAGGIALGNGVGASALDAWLLGSFDWAALSAVGVLALLTAIGLGMANVISHSAAANLLIPLAIGFSDVVGAEAALIAVWSRSPRRSACPCRSRRRRTRSPTPRDRSSSSTWRSSAWSSASAVPAPRLRDAPDLAVLRTAVMDLLVLVIGSGPRASEVAANLRTALGDRLPVAVAEHVSGALDIVNSGEATCRWWCCVPGRRRRCRHAGALRGRPARARPDDGPDHQDGPPRPGGGHRQGLAPHARRAAIPAGTPRVDGHLPLSSWMADRDLDPVPVFAPPEQGSEPSELFQLLEASNEELTERIVRGIDRALTPRPRMVLPPGVRLTRQGEDVDGVFILISGKVALTRATPSENLLLHHASTGRWWGCSPSPASRRPSSPRPPPPRSRRSTSPRTSSTVPSSSTPESPPASPPGPSGV